MLFIHHHDGLREGVGKVKGPTSLGGAYPYPGDLEKLGHNFKIQHGIHWKAWGVAEKR